MVALPALRLRLWLRSARKYLFILQASFLSLLCLFHATFFFFGLDFQPWHGCGSTIIIEGDIHKIGSVGMSLFAGNRILRKYLNFRFHRSVPSVTNFCVDDNEVANANGLTEEHRVNGNGHHFALGMAHTSQRT